MGLRGPPPTPTKILRMRASWRANRNPREPQPVKARPKCPSWLRPIARVAFREMSDELFAMGLLSTADRNALARYCQTWARWRECEEFLSKHGTTYPIKIKDVVVGMKNFPQVKQADALATQLLRLEQQFGLTPSARTRLEVRMTETDEDDAKKFLKVGAG